MKKRILAMLLIAALTVSLFACGNSSQKPADASNQNSSMEEDDSGKIEVEKELFDVIVTLPADFVGETTQEELDEAAKENGYKAVLNEDGSVTYTMTKSQHKKMLKATAESINEGLASMIGSEDYPNFTDIKANDNFTSFTITTTSTELSFNEGFSVLAFYIYGGMYTTLEGEVADNIHVEFVNADSGEIIDTADSKDMEE